MLNMHVHVCLCIVREEKYFHVQSPVTHFRNLEYLTYSKQLA